MRSGRGPAVSGILAVLMALLLIGMYFVPIVRLPESVSNGLGIVDALTQRVNGAIELVTGEKGLISISGLKHPSLFEIDKAIWRYGDAVLPSHTDVMVYGVLAALPGVLAVLASILTLGGAYIPAIPAALAVGGVLYYLIDRYSLTAVLKNGVLDPGPAFYLYLPCLIAFCCFALWAAAGKAFRRGRNGS